MVLEPIILFRELLFSFFTPLENHPFVFIDEITSLQKFAFGLRFFFFGGGSSLGFAFRSKQQNDILIPIQNLKVLNI